MKFSSRVFCSLLLSLSTLYCMAGSAGGWQLAFDAGYGFQAANANLGSLFEEVGPYNISGAAANREIRQPYGTLGSGFRFGTTLGYAFNEHISVAAQFNFIRSLSINLASVDVPGFRAFHDVHAWRVVITPHLKLSAPMGKMELFARVGPVIPIYGSVTSMIFIDDDIGQVAEEVYGLSLPGLETDVEAKGITRPRFSYGALAAMGLEIPLKADRLYFKAEVYFEALSIVSKKTTVTDYLQQTRSNGTRILEENNDNIFESTRRINYVNVITPSSNNEEFNPGGFSTSLPTEELKFKQNFNNAGIQLGVILRLGKTAAAAASFEDL